MLNFSTKFSKVSASPTIAIDSKFKQLKAEGEDVLGFGIGEPDFPTPENICRAGIKAITDGKTRYTPASGMRSLKQAICDKLKRDNELDFTPNQIVVSNGAKHSLQNVFFAILNAGDEVIIPAPYWVSYPEMVKMADGVPVYIDCEEENNFTPTVEQLQQAITPKTKAIIINSPSNPTGMIYGEVQLAIIAKLAEKHNLFVIADEIYEKLIYNGKHISIGKFLPSENFILINGVSKTYAMTGWRIGYTATSIELAKIMGNIQSHSASNPSTISQEAAIEALNGEQSSVDEMKKAFKERRDYLVNALNEIENISCLNPDGAFYVMVNLREVLNGKTADEFCQNLLEVAKIALVPSEGFGIEGYARWSYATSMADIEEGVKRFKNFVENTWK